MLFFCCCFCRFSKKKADDDDDDNWKKLPLYWIAIKPSKWKRANIAHNVKSLHLTFQALIFLNDRTIAFFLVLLCCLALYIQLTGTRLIVAVHTCGPLCGHCMMLWLVWNALLSFIRIFCGFLSSFFFIQTVNVHKCNHDDPSNDFSHVVNHTK